MKILYVAPEYPSAGRNAAQVRANSLLPRLAEGVDLRVLAFPPPEGEVNGDTVAQTTKVDRVNPGKLDLFRGTYSRTPRAFLRYGAFQARHSFASMLEDFRPDVVHFDSIATLALFDLACSAASKPRIVAQTHDSVSELYRRMMDGAPLLRRMITGPEQRKYARIEREELSLCDSVIVDSPEDADFLRGQTGGRRVDLIPIGVDANRFSPKGEKAKLGSRAIIFSGSMASEQSADAADFLVNRIMPRVWQRFPDAHVHLVGGNPTPRVSALVQKRVTVTGFVEDLPAYLRAASVYACPLRLGSGMRTRVIEALACGSRIVASSFAVRGIALPEEGEAPWLVGDDEFAMAQGIERVLDGSEPSLSMRAAQHAAGQYSWAAVAGQLITVYRSLLELD